MTVTIEVPESMVTAIHQRGESVPEYLVRAAEDALGPDAATIEQRRRVIEEMLRDAKGRTLGQSIRSAMHEGHRY